MTSFLLNGCSKSKHFPSRPTAVAFMFRMAFRRPSCFAAAVDEVLAGPSVENLQRLFPWNYEPSQWCGEKSWAGRCMLHATKVVESTPASLRARKHYFTGA